MLNRRQLIALAAGAALPSEQAAWVSTYSITLPYTESTLRAWAEPPTLLARLQVA